MKTYTPDNPKSRSAQFLNFSISQFLNSALLAALAALPLAAQPVTREGRYWVQTVEGSVPAGGCLRVTSVGSITVRGETTNQVRYTAKKKCAPILRPRPRSCWSIPRLALRAKV